ncbi:MAG TPA: class I SAM-dependent methyltransferase [Solirubrobacterales bacterium]|nr:class I SAM-dependent methyltransferase [Solirubrobacterales bacterium]
MDPALSAYEAFASIYDEFTDRNDYEEWFDALLPELDRRGLRKGRLLDVGCGTGRAFEPMLQRGWQVVGCDLSPAMLGQAQAKFAEVRLEVADARELPVFGEFDLVWALNEVLSYLLEDGDLERALAGMRANLAPDGRVVFDAGSQGLFQSTYTARTHPSTTSERWSWTGLADRVEPGGTYEGRISGPGVATHLHRQRHYTMEQVQGAMDGAGLTLLAALGQRDRPGAIALFDPPDEARHDRIVYIAESGTGSS